MFERIHLMRMAAVIGLGIVSAPCLGQTYSTTNGAARPARADISGQVDREYGVVRGSPDGWRSYYYPARSNLPTYMTSINYPLIYGGYLYPYPAGSFTYGTAQTRFTGAPSWYMDNYLRSYETLVEVTPGTPPAAARGSALINIRVPANAQLRFNGVAARETGEERRYAVPDLVPGTTYSYDISASWVDNGVEVT